jgi:hypothetical protein
MTEDVREGVIAFAARCLLKQLPLNHVAFERWQPFVASLTEDETNLMVHWMDVHAAQTGEPPRDNRSILDGFVLR